VSQVTIETRARRWWAKTLTQIERELGLTIVQYKNATKMDFAPRPNIVIEG